MAFNRKQWILAGAIIVLAAGVLRVEIAERRRAAGREHRPGSNGRIEAVEIDISTKESGAHPRNPRRRRRFRTGK